MSEPQGGGARSVGVQDTARQPGRGRPASARRAAVGAAGERDRGELRIEDAVVEYATAGGATIRAVDGVTLTIAPGEIVALLGASGSGKSSLLRAIAGLEPLAGGRIAWDGEDVGRLPVHRRGFGLMFQEPVLFPNLDVGANVAYGLDRMPRRGSDRRAATVERMLELVPFLAGLADADAAHPDAQALRWELEELRVQLFAQELGVKGGVSPKRLAARLERLQKTG